MIVIEAAGNSDIGKVRKANEDSWLIDKSMGLYVVADGMGGHRGGAVASQLATKTMGKYMAATCEQPSGGNRSSTEATQKEALKRLLQSIALANHRIHALSMKNASCRGMGTTIAALILSEKFIITANVGDSPIYLVRNGEVKDLYTPHTLLHDRKKIPKSMEGRFPPGKLAHVLTRAVGIRQNVRIDHVAMPSCQEDRVVICSDGLSGKVSKKEIGTLVTTYDSVTACKKLTELALQRGGQDNITVIVVNITATGGNPSKGLFGRFFALPVWLGSFFKSKRSPSDR